MIERQARTIVLVLTPGPSLASLHRRACQAARALESVSWCWVPRCSVVARQDAPPPQTEPAGHSERCRVLVTSDLIGARFVPLQVVSTAPLRAPALRAGVRLVCRLRFHTSGPLLPVEVGGEIVPDLRLRAPERYSCELLLNCPIIASAHDSAWQTLFCTLRHRGGARSPTRRLRCHRRSKCHARFHPAVPDSAGWRYAGCRSSPTSPP